MRVIWRGIGVAIVSCVLAGCTGGDQSESVTTPDDPQAGLDMIKKMEKMPNYKEVANVKRARKSH
jgi:hypothetical protein